MTLESRYWIQVASLIFFAAATGGLAALVITRRLPWRYSVLPGWLLAQLTVFYIYVVFVMGPGVATMAVTTYISAVIRVQTGAFALGVMITLWKWLVPKKK